MRLGAADLAGMRPTYVTALFDQYAPKFEAALVDDLGYRGPALLLAAVLGACAAAGRPPAFGRVIDLGCGTGLAARAFAGIADEMIGIDLSPRMIARARATGLYAEVDVAEIAEGLSRQPAASADLILAADVMVYVHDMTPLLAEVARVLTPGGLFAFTLESHAGEGVVLGEGLRSRREPSVSADRRHRPRARAAGAGIVALRGRRAGAGPGRGRGEALISREAFRVPRGRGWTNPRGYTNLDLPDW